MDQAAHAGQHRGGPFPRQLRNGLNLHRCLQSPLQLRQQAGIELDSLRVRANVTQTVETARQLLETIVFECFQVSQGNLRLVADLLECETPSSTGDPQQLTKSDMVLGGLGARLGLVGSEVWTCSHALSVDARRWVCLFDFEHARRCRNVGGSRNWRCRSRLAARS